MQLFKDDSSGAEFSPCRKYRYSLWRIWDKKRLLCSFICLNPSTADEVKNDPTVRRCINYAESWGYGGFVMLNLFAFRATVPADMFSVEDPVGKNNDNYIKHWVDKSAIVVLAWGNGGLFNSRCNDVLRYLKTPYCLSITNQGQPSHPLYLKKNLKPIRYRSWWNA